MEIIYIRSIWKIVFSMPDSLHKFFYLNELQMIIRREKGDMHLVLLKTKFIAISRRVLFAFLPFLLELHPLRIVTIVPPRIDERFIVGY